MPTAYFPSLPNEEVVDVTFIDLSRKVERYKLLVDSGFTGDSYFVLPEQASGLVYRRAPSANLIGALRGEQQRWYVNWQVDALLFGNLGVAILADVTELSLPEGVDGLAGLPFLRLFNKWGSMCEEGNWKFFLHIDSSTTSEDANANEEGKRSG